MTGPLTKSALAALSGAPFDVLGVDVLDADGRDAGGLALDLAAVEGLPGAAEREDCFVLTFRAPALLPQGAYRLRHEALGTHEVFLVPVRQDAAGVYLEAVFNRMGARPA
jgi:hypothetical protein